ncbi:MAG: D-alanine--D-alanine ligase [Clostridia bacterium]|nr:D-alanine--D-alanine ligase [Clostridia bacterium]
MKNIALIYGGNSCEKDISIITALQSLEAIDKKKYNVFPIYWQESFYILDEYKNVDSYTGEAIKGKKVIFQGKSLYVMKKNKLKLLAEIDCALLCTHGGKGENGALQGFFEVQNIPFTSPSHIASGIGMDKALCKMICKKLTLPVLPYGVVNEGDSEEVLDRIVERLGFPLIVKPANQGSSIGIGVSKDQDELKEKLKTAFYYDSKVVIEKALTDFKEINCACLRKNGNIYPSTLEEPVGWQDFLTFEDKYMSGGKVTKTSAKRIFPAQISENDKIKIQNITSKLYQALGCKGIVRCDFLIDKENNCVYLNEINTIPGSMAGYLYEDKGFYLKDILEIIIEDAIKDSKEAKSAGFSSKVLQYYSKNKANACKVSLKNV